GGEPLLCVAGAASAVYNTYCKVMVDRFFFQAEDGIRDWSVTGVQTCALPIYRHGGRLPHLVPYHLAPPGTRAASAPAGARQYPVQRGCPRRSEERRVGKE